MAVFLPRRVAGSDDNAVDPLLQHYPHRILLGLPFLVAVAQQQMKARLARHVGHAAQRQTKMRVLDIADNHADGVRSPGVHGARHLVRPVAQRCRRAVDSRLYLFTDGAVAAERPGRLRF